MSSRAPFGVEHELAVDGVADWRLSDRRASRFVLPSSDLALEVRPDRRSAVWRI